MAIVGASGEVRLFEPPTKPRASMKALKESHKKEIEAMKFKQRTALTFMKVDFKDDLFAAKAGKKSAQEIEAIKKAYAEKRAKQIEDFNLRLEQTKEQQKKEIEQKRVSFAEHYEKDIALWNAEPEISAAEAAEQKAELDAKLAAYKQRAKETKAAQKEELAKAKQLSDPAAKKLAITQINDKYHNLLLDIGEEKRVAMESYERAVYSQSKIYRIHTRKKSFAAFLRDKQLLFMLIPFILFFAIFHYAPMYSIQIAFKDFRIRVGVWNSPWIGFRNFQMFLGGPYFPRLIRNTFMINFYKLIFGFAASPIFALLLNEVRNKLFKTTVQTISYLPHFVSSVVVAGLVVNFLAPSGLINNVYTSFASWLTGREVQSIYFLVKPEYFRAIFVIMGIWAGVGFGSIIYTSALAGVDQELYEAAKIDGAGRWRQLLSITIPGIMPTIAIMLIMEVGRLLSLGYETIILLYQPSTYETADVISTYSYRMSFDSTKPNYSMSAAIGLFNALISLTLVTISNKISHKLGDVGLW